MSTFAGIGNPNFTVITGSMFSGKSNELGRRVTNIDYYNHHYLGTPINYIILRPNIDVRDEKIRKTPYSNYKFIDPATLEPANDDKIDLNIYDLIAFDEAQFFSDNLIDLVKKLLAMNKQVIVVGLDKDRNGEPFSNFMMWSLCVCDEVLKLSAMCAKCGRESSFSEMVSDNPSDSKIVIESENSKYVPKCRKHYHGNYDIDVNESDLILSKTGGDKV